MKKPTEKTKKTDDKTEATDYNLNRIDTKSDVKVRAWVNIYDYAER